MFSEEGEIWAASFEAADWIIRMLEGRGGFDEWWSQIDCDTRSEIRLEIAKIVDGAGA